MGKVLSKIAVCAALSAAASASSENVRALEDQIAHFKEIRQFWNDKIGNSEQKLAAERAILGDGDCKVGSACPDGSECPTGYAKNPAGYCMCPDPSKKDAKGLPVGAKREEHNKYAKCGTAPFSLKPTMEKCGVPATLYAAVTVSGNVAQSAPDRAGLQVIQAVRNKDWLEKQSYAVGKTIIPINVGTLANKGSGYKVCMFADGLGIHVVPKGGPSSTPFDLPLY